MIAADGVELRVSAIGDGPPVLMLHGAGLSGAIWRGLGYAREGTGFQAIAVDLRGHGRSDAPTISDAYRWDAFVNDLIGVLDHFSLESTHVLGYSLGARIGLELAIRAPERVKSLSLLGANHRRLAGIADDLFFPGGHAVLRDQGMAEFLTRWELASAQPIGAETAFALSQTDARALAALFEALERTTDIPEVDIHGIAAPTLLVTGTADRYQWPAGEELARILPRVTSVALPGIDHVATLADPRTASAVFDFLRQIEDTRPQ